MKICIIGSRSITDKEKVYLEINKFIKNHSSSNYTCLISGGAKGVDSAVKCYAREHGYDFVEFIPYHLLDKKVDFKPFYFFARNKQMIDNADKVLALWDGESKGTSYTIEYAKKKGIPVCVVIV